MLNKTNKSTGFPPEQLKRQLLTMRDPLYHGFYPLPLARIGGDGVVKKFSTILLKGGLKFFLGRGEGGREGLKFFLGGEELDGKVFNFWIGNQGFCRQQLKILLHNSYVTSFLWADSKELYHLSFFTYVFSLFHFIESLFNGVLLLIAYLRAKIYRSLHKWVLNIQSQLFFIHF